MQPAAAMPAGRRWLLGPWVDLFFVANVTWPIVFLWMVWGGPEAHEQVSFWRIYYVTTPHRWVTMLLVFCDRERFRARPRAFLGVAAAIIAVCLFVRVSTGTLTCLLAISFAWNAWHFAAQHHGIFRIYGRMSQPERTSGMAAEKVLMRSFIIYVIFRTATWTWLASEFHEIEWFDLAAMAVPVWLLVRDARGFDRRAVGRVAYLASLTALYVGLLISVRMKQPGFILLLTTASAMFHAVEYLAIVSWSVRSRHGKAEASDALFGRLLPQWLIVLIAFVCVIGTGSWLMESNLLRAWLLINAIVAFLHFSYDGMIWKSRRRPQSA